MGIPVHSVAIRQTDGLSPFILWTYERERSFLPPGRRGKLLRLFPGGAENNLFKYFAAGGWKGCWKERAWSGLSPVQKQELWRGLLLLSEDNPPACYQHMPPSRLSLSPAGDNLRSAAGRKLLLFPQSPFCQFRSSTPGRKDYSSNPSVPRFIFLPQNEKRGWFFHSMAGFSAKTPVLLPQNGKMGVFFHSMAKRWADIHSVARLRPKGHSVF